MEGLTSPLTLGQSEPFTVRMDTGTRGTESGQISLANNDSDEHPFNFAIAGAVVAAEAYVYIGDAVAAEGNSGLTDFTLTVTLYANFPSAGSLNPGTTSIPTWASTGTGTSTTPRRWTLTPRPVR